MSDLNWIYLLHYFFHFNFVRSACWNIHFIEDDSDRSVHSLVRMSVSEDPELLRCLWYGLFKLFHKGAVEEHYGTLAMYASCRSHTEYLGNMLKVNSNRIRIVSQFLILKRCSEMKKKNIMSACNYPKLLPLALHWPVFKGCCSFPTFSATIVFFFVRGDCNCPATYDGKRVEKCSPNRWRCTWTREMK